MRGPIYDGQKRYIGPLVPLLHYPIDCTDCTSNFIGILQRDGATSWRTIDRRSILNGGGGYSRPSPPLTIIVIILLDYIWGAGTGVRPRQVRCEMYMSDEWGTSQFAAWWWLLFTTNWRRRSGRVGRLTPNGVKRLEDVLILIRDEFYFPRQAGMQGCVCVSYFDTNLSPIASSRTFWEVMRLGNDYSSVGNNPSPSNKLTPQPIWSYALDIFVVRAFIRRR